MMDTVPKIVELMSTRGPTSMGWYLPPNIVEELTVAVDEIAAENTQLRAELESKEGECNFLYSHLVKLVSEVASSGKPKICGRSRIYTPQIEAGQIDTLYHELRVMHQKETENA